VVDNPRGDRHMHPRPVHLDFPSFDGENPAAWTYKVNQFFDYYNTPLYQRVRMASFHMEGEALVWFQDADEDGQFPTWAAFTQALLVRFGHAYDDPMESLVKLRQSSMVGDYTARFESLSNRLWGLSDKYKLSCFLSGLKDEIRLPLNTIIYIHSVQNESLCMYIVILLCIVYKNPNIFCFFFFFFFFLKKIKNKKLATWHIDTWRTYGHVPKLHMSSWPRTL
jgi:hypothetical protein